MITLIQGDCMEKLKELPDNSVDSIVTDPPYNLTCQRVYSEKKELEDIGGDGSLRENIKNNTGYGSLVKGFMGQTWDGTGITFNPELWKESKVDYLEILMVKGLFNISLMWSTLVRSNKAIATELTERMKSKGLIK